MKKSIVLFAVLFSMLSLNLSSCEKDDKDDDLPGITESSFTLTIQGITATNATHVQVCNDGFFEIIGEDPSGGAVSFSTSEINVGETRNICDFQLDQTNFDACMANNGFNIFLVMPSLQSLFSPVSGTATRTSERSITISGVVMDITSLQTYPFTLEATAGVLTPIDCK